MRGTSATYNVIIIGGGFYGISLALALRKHYKRILIVEKAGELMTQASYVNQATIHNGYHYPRSHMTALRSLTNFPLFTREFSEAVYDKFVKIYAIAVSGSKTSAQQFKLFCDRIGAPNKPADAAILQLFDERMIEQAFQVEEYAFDANILRDLLTQRLAKAKVEVLFEAEVRSIAEKDGSLRVSLTTGDTLTAEDQVISCTYANTNDILTRSGLKPLPVKYEFTEVALIKVPTSLEKLGITVMDGPFFATMPFPMTPYHSLTHVRYTPQTTFENTSDFTNLKAKSNFPYMIKDASRYLPVIGEAEYQSSLFTVKAVLPQNERDDGRPILYRKDYGLKKFSVVLGGKIVTNLYKKY